MLILYHMPFPITTRWCNNSFYLANYTAKTHRSEFKYMHRAYKTGWKILGENILKSRGKNSSRKGILRRT